MWRRLVSWAWLVMCAAGTVLGIAGWSDDAGGWWSWVQTNLALFISIVAAICVCLGVALANVADWSFWRRRARVWAGRCLATTRSWFVAGRGTQARLVLLEGDEEKGAARIVRLQPGRNVIEFPAVFDAYEGSLMVAVGPDHRLIFEDAARWSSHSGSGYYHAKWDVLDDQPMRFVAELVPHTVLSERSFDQTHD